MFKTRLGTSIVIILLLLNIIIGFSNITDMVNTYPVEGTGSMLPTVTPDTQVETKAFNGNLKCGHTYIYEKADENKTVMHRFVYEDNKGKIYMKGDNNKAYDKPINKSQIIREVKGYKWN